MSEREHIPAATERAVLVEAGHRCAIPTCRQFPVEIHHIQEVAKGGSNEFNNLIALCATDHDRVTGGYITRLEVESYKANLGVINARYGDLEQRVLALFADNPAATHALLPTGLELLMSFLINDEMVELRVPADEVNTMRYPSFREYWLTGRGKELVARWVAAQPIE